MRMVRTILTMMMTPLRVETDESSSLASDSADYVLAFLEVSETVIVIVIVNAIDEADVAMT